MTETFKEGNSVRTLQLPTRIRNSLLGEDIKTIDQLRSMSFDHLLNVENIGKTAVQEIVIALELHDAGGAAHCTFAPHARIAEGILGHVQSGPGWEKCNARQQKVLWLLALLLGFVAERGPSYLDRWETLARFVEKVGERFKWPKSCSQQPAKR